MRIDGHDRVVSFTIFDAPKLDPVTVVMQDFGPGNGRLIVECYSTAWSAYWGAMGNRRIHEFLIDCDAGYIETRLIPNDRKVLKREEAYLARIVPVVQEALRLLALPAAGTAQEQKP